LGHRQLGNFGMVLSMNPLLITGSGALAAAGAMAYGAVHPRSQFFGRSIWRTNSRRKLAMTFDDGPNPAITPKLLDLLDRYNAKATFFLNWAIRARMPGTGERNHCSRTHRRESHRNAPESFVAGAHTSPG